MARTRSMKKNPTDRCSLCGLRTQIHFTINNRKLTCQEAAEAHPRASVRALPLASAFAAILGGAR